MLLLQMGIFSLTFACLFIFMAVFANEGISPLINSIKENEYLPHSNIPKAAIGNYNCYPPQLAIINAVITKNNINEEKRFTPGTKVSAKCNPGFSFEEDDKYKEEFQLTCNGSTGFWDGAKTCIKRCNLKRLLLLSGESEAEVFDFKTQKFKKVKNLNYISEGNIIKINCIGGSKIFDTQGATDVTGIKRSSHYYTMCVDGENFSIGSKVPRCRKLDFCDNTDIKVDGILQNPKAAYEFTRQGQKVSFVCKGDNAQEGLYFKNGEEGQVVPECQNSQEKGYHWSSDTFKCFNGCIGKEGQKMNILDLNLINSSTDFFRLKANVRKNSSGRDNYFHDQSSWYHAIDHFIPGPLHVVNDKSDQRAWQKDVITPDRYSLFYTFVYNTNTGYEGYDKDKMIFSDMADYFGDQGFFDHNGQYTIGIGAERKINFGYCKSRQTEYENVTLNYKSANFSIGLLRYSANGYGIIHNPTFHNISFFMFFNLEQNKRCRGSICCGNQQNGDTCLQSIESRFNSKPIKLNSTYHYDGNDVALCNLFIQQTIPNPSIANCVGYYNVQASSPGWLSLKGYRQCAAYVTVPSVAQVVECNINGRTFRNYTALPKVDMDSDITSNSSRSSFTSFIVPLITIQ